jgi:hypothetical protein
MTRSSCALTDSDVLYESDGRGLKHADRKMRNLRSISIFLLDVAILYGVYFVLEIITGFGLGLSLGSGSVLILMIIFLALSILVLPAPILMTPGRYRILSTGVDSDGKRLIPLRPNYKTRANNKRMFVSVLHPRRGEFMRLYASEPAQLQQAILKVIEGRKQRKRR